MAGGAACISRGAFVALSCGVIPVLSGDRYPDTMLVTPLVALFGEKRRENLVSCMYMK